MPNPVVSDVHVNRPLTNLSVAFAQETSDFIAGTVFPEVGSSARSDEYFIYNRADWFRIEAKKRAAGTESAGGGYSLQRDSFRCERTSLHDDVDDPTIANADDALAPIEDSTLYLTENVLRAREREWATNFFATSIWGTDLTGVPGAPAGGQFQQWDQAGSTPIEDVDTAKDSIRETTGRRANTIVTTPYVFTALKNNTAILDRIKYTQRATITEDLLAALFGVDRFLVASGVSNTAVEGAAEANSFILGKHLLLAHVAPNPGLRIPSAGYTFVWTGMGQGPNGFRVKRFRMEATESERVEVDAWWDQKVVAADLGYFFSGAVA